MAEDWHTAEAIYRADWSQLPMPEQTMPLDDAGALEMVRHSRTLQASTATAPPATPAVVTGYSGPGRPDASALRLSSIRASSYAPRVMAPGRTCGTTPHCSCARRATRRKPAA